MHDLKVVKQTNRKDEHLSFAKLFQQPKSNDFDAVRLLHQSISNLDVAHVNLSTSFLGMQFTRPFYINAMTGGSAKGKKINEKLGVIAKEFGLLIATGSVSAALKDETLAPSFHVIRENNPKGRIFANISASSTVDDAKRAIEVVDADGLQIHLNTAQELLMKEGERHFSTWTDNILQIQREVHVPIIVKEVGFGMNLETLKILQSLGVKAIDVSGKGGTNFIQIENKRQNLAREYFEDWGLSTVESLLETTLLRSNMDILASGGIRNALDVVKCIALGAKSVGISGSLLHVLQTKGTDAAIEWIQTMEEEVRIVMTMLGCRTFEDLQNNATLLFDEKIQNYAAQRNISLSAFSRKG